MFTNHVISATMTWTVHENVLPDKLSVVLIRREHVGFHILFGGLDGQGSNHIVGFEAVSLQDRDMEGSQDFLDNRHTLCDIFRRFLSLGLISREGFMAESLSVIECYTEVIRPFFCDDFMQRVDETEYGRGVESLGIDARRTD